MDLEKLKVAHLIEVFPVFYRITRLIMNLTRFFHCLWSRNTPIRSKSCNIISLRTIFRRILQSTRICPKWYFVRKVTKNEYYPSDVSPPAETIRFLLDEFSWKLIPAVSLKLIENSSSVKVIKKQQALFENIITFVSILTVSVAIIAVDINR